MSETMVGVTQTRAARIAGAMYLFVMATAVFGESYVRGSLIVWGNAAQTAQNIVPAERLFRIAIATDLVTYSAIIVKIWALYVLLKPVERNLALLGVLFETAEVAVTYVATVFSSAALTLFRGADYLRTLDASQLHSLALFVMSLQGRGLSFSFVLTGLGSMVFAYLLVRSGYVPKVLAGWGVFSSLLLAMSVILVIVFPVMSRFEFAMMLPIGIYEVVLGFWLLLKGAKILAS